MHILEQHKNAVAKEKVNIVAVDSTHGKNSNASRTVGSSENLGGRGGKGHCALKYGFTWTFPNQDATMKLKSKLIFYQNLVVFYCPC